MAEEAQCRKFFQVPETRENLAGARAKLSHVGDGSYSSVVYLYPAT